MNIVEEARNMLRKWKLHEFFILSLPQLHSNDSQ